MEPERDELLHEDFLRKLERLRLAVGKTLLGPKRGEHRSWRSGTSQEFLDHRKYQPGDDIRYVDWNVYGRLDKLFLKLFRSEEDLSVHVLIDCSLSMGMGTPSKLHYGRKMAAALGYIALANMDQVAVVSFSDTLKETTPWFKGRKAYLSLVRFLTALKTNGATRISDSLIEFAFTGPRPGLVVILSDFLDEKGLGKGLEALRQRKFRVVLLQILDPEEMRPSWGGLLALRDIETHQQKKIALSPELLDLYRKKMETFLKDIRMVCQVYGAHYRLLQTGIPFEDFIWGGILGEDWSQ